MHFFIHCNWALILFVDLIMDKSCNAFLTSIAGMEVKEEGDNEANQNYASWVFRALMK